MNILILEDDRGRQEKFIQNTVGHVRVITDMVTACIESLKAAIELNNPIDILFLDHDLGSHIMQESGPGTGYEVAVWLEEHPRYQPKHIVIHSFNPDGAMRMNAALPKAVRWPGAWDKDIYAIIEYLEQHTHKEAGI